MKTLTVDDFQRVQLPDVVPGTKFVYEKDRYGRIVLIEFKAARARSAKVRFQKRKGRTVATTNRTISVNAIRAAIDEFP